ncbi:TetR/AcrR family transcriptional regulator [Rhodoferax sp.]|uniref:TetR/AcrR family transcriptional regulator n=1 Tax=Rhodoferax sp. TaxID=50421 RepID=UPI0025CC3B8F|nr:TetR/AcrR family transcriptional regulator [Rhodoferax sp.]
MLNEAPTAKHHILDCGERLIATKGFVGVGLAEILAVAGVPKGSFYHYFSSKERFGEALLVRYMERYVQGLDAMFRPDGETGRVRLMRYWQHWNSTQCATSCDTVGGTGNPATTSTKCLVVKLSAEVADISEAMRLTLRDGTDQIVQRIAQCLEDGHADGSVPAHLPAPATALTLYQLWLGASLLSKLRRDNSPFEPAMRATQQILDSTPA